MFTLLYSHTYSIIFIILIEFILAVLSTPTHRYGLELQAFWKNHRWVKSQPNSSARQINFNENVWLFTTQKLVKKESTRLAPITIGLVTVDCLIVQCEGWRQWELLSYNANYSTIHSKIYHIALINIVEYSVYYTYIHREVYKYTNSEFYNIQNIK